MKQATNSNEIKNFNSVSQNNQVETTEYVGRKSVVGNKFSKSLLNEMIEDDVIKINNDHEVIELFLPKDQEVELETNIKVVKRSVGFLNRNRRSDSAESAGSPPSKKITAEGVERGGPGLDYQVHLSMYFVRQGYELSRPTQQSNQLSDFELGKEQINAGKFDDIVMRYKADNIGQKWNYLLLQSKYKQDKQDKITTGQLLSVDNTNPFALIKYFSSYVKLSKEYEGKEKNVVENIVIATNTQFQFDDEGEKKLNPTKAKKGEKGGRAKNCYLKDADAINEILKMQEADAAKYWKFDYDKGDLLDTLTKEFKSNYQGIKKKPRKKGIDNEIIENLKDIMEKSEKDLKELLCEFLDKLLFVTNLPDGKKLREITQKKIGKEFFFLDESIIDQFNRKTFDYTITPGQEFLKKDAIEKLFLKIKEKINNIKFRPCYYLHNIDKYTKINFRENQESVKNFFSENNNKKILTVKTDSKFLTALKTYKILRQLSSAQYSYDDKHFFVNLKELLEVNNLKDNIIESFGKEDGHNLLIVILDDTAQPEFLKTLCDVLAKNDKKKVVFITDKNSQLDLSEVNKGDTEDTEDNSNKFGDLTEEAQRDLLDKSVIFQGESTSLKDLYFKLEDDKSPLAEQLNQLEIDPKTLESLIRDEIKIEKPISISDLHGAYSKFYEEIDVEILKENLLALDHNESDRFFIISGIDGSNKIETLIEILQKANSIQTSINKDLINEIGFFDQKTHKIIVADSEFIDGNFKKLCHDNPQQKIYWINWKNNKFILQSLYNPDFLPRKFEYPEKINIDTDIKIELCKNDLDSQFIFTGVDKLEDLFTVLQLQEEKDKNTLRANYRTGKVIIQEGTQELKFDQLYKTTHWLDIRDKKTIIWKKSHGPLSNLPKYGQVEPLQVNSEQELIDIVKDKSSIFIDKPGMGKSTTLTILSNKALKSHWVIFITLRDWQENINNLPDNIDTKVVYNFLLDTLSIKTPLEQNLANHILSQKDVKPLLLLFDGFDEIRSYDIDNNIGKGKFESLLNFLQHHTKSTIWITAREHDAETLRNALSIFDTKFKPLTKPEQERYLKNIWRNSLQLSFGKDKLKSIFDNDQDETIFQQYYKELSDAISSIGQKNDFMGIPLTLSLFIESFRDKFKSFIKSNNRANIEDFDNLSIWELYEYFIDAKFKIFFREKTNLSSGFTKTSEDWFRGTLLKLHSRLALQELFGKEITNQLVGVKKPFDYGGNVNNQQLQELLSFGIIRSVQENHFEFLHRTFAEYFVSDLFAYMLRNKKLSNKGKYLQVVEFLQDNILKQSNAVIYKFLYVILEKDQKLKGIWRDITREDQKERNLLGEQNQGIKSVFDQFSDIQGRAIRAEEADTEAGDIKSIRALRTKVEGCVAWKDKMFRYNERDYKTDNIERLVEKCFTEKNVDELKYTIEYLATLCGKSEFRKFNNVLTEMIIIEIVLKQRDNLELEFINNVLSQLSPSISPSSEKYQSLKKDILENTDDRHVKEMIVKSRLLTPEIAKIYNSKLGDPSFDHSKVFYQLIRPLLVLVLVQHLTTSIDKFAFIDKFTLLEMFRVYADSDNLVLNANAVDGLLECIKDLLDPKNISTDGFIASIRSLLVLRNWGFSLTDSDQDLYLSLYVDKKKDMKCHYLYQEKMK